MKGTTSTQSTGTGTMLGRAPLVGVSSGVSTCTSWFPQIGVLSGSSAGASIVVQVYRIPVNATSTITTIAEYESII